MADSDTSSPRTLIVDLGKKKRKQVKRLRKGRGRLASRIDDLVQELREGGEISADADTVVVIVEKKRRRRRRWNFRL